MKMYKKYIIGGIALALALVVSGSIAAKVRAQFVYTAVMASPQFTLLGCPDLSTGSTGTCVVQLQGILSELGHLNVPAAIPLGYFGPLTRSALIQYQSSLAVPATGVFDIPTRAQMQTSFNSRGWLALLFPASTAVIR